MHTPCSFTSRNRNTAHSNTLKNLKRPSYKFEALGFKGVFEG
jgi:hypothetical protein